MNLVNYRGCVFYEDHGNLVEMVLTGNDLPVELELLKEMGITAISLNRFFCGDRINELDFLKEVPDVKVVHICDNDLFEYDGLYGLPNLEELSIGGGKAIDYSRFHSLKKLITSQSGPFLFPDSLESLSIWHTRLRAKGLSSLNFPESLKRLYIYWSDIADLKGLPTGLEVLEIARCRSLISLCGLENSEITVKRLIVENCPHLRDYGALYSCESMEYMILAECKEIESISFVRNMKGLRHFTFRGTTVLDGDLQYIAEVPYVFFKDNKNYNRKMADFR